MNKTDADFSLFGAITRLASSPDDISGIDQLLVQIASLTASSVAAADYASITAQRSGAPTTVALSNDIALAIDEAQYADQAGPCLDALDAGIPIGVMMATTMEWPGFRQAATELGVQASLSIPLFAGSGQPIAALNLYARDAGALAPLSGALLSLFDFDSDRQSATDDVHILPELFDDAGGTQLLAGLSEAFTIQQRIHVAIGILMQRDGSPIDRAYVTLREQAAATDSNLVDTAQTVVDQLSQQ
jgi:hypothetical protein